MAAILLVEDDMVLGHMLARYLRVHGDRVVLAYDGESALAEVRKREFDIVVTDINMPRGDGIELITSLTESGCSAQIVAISGGGMLPKEHLLEDAGLLGAAATLAKPFEAEDLRRVLHELLGRKS